MNTEETYEDTLVKRISAAIDSFNIRMINIEQRIAEGRTLGIQSLAQSAAEEIEAQRRLDLLYNELTERIGQLEKQSDAEGSPENKETVNRKLNVLRQLQISTEKSSRSQKDLMFRIRLEYLQKKTQEISLSELRQELSLWTKRADMDRPELHPDLREHALKCKRICQAALDKRHEE